MGVVFNVKVVHLTSHHLSLVVHLDRNLGKINGGIMYMICVIKKVLLM